MTTRALEDHEIKSIFENISGLLGYWRGTLLVYGISITFWGTFNHGRGLVLPLFIYAFFFFYIVGF
jgi:hypothetical protein